MFAVSPKYKSCASDYSRTVCGSVILLTAVFLTLFSACYFPGVIHYLSSNIPVTKGFSFSIIVVPTVHLLTCPQDMHVICYVEAKEETMTF